MDRLLKSSDAKPTAESIRLLRVKFDECYQTERALYSEYLNKWRALNEAQAALASAEAELKASASKVAPLIGAEKLKREVDDLMSEHVNSLKRRGEVQEQLQREEAVFARREILKFINDKDKRHAKTPENFSKAMAGLPENGWFSSFRKCNRIRYRIKSAPISLAVLDVLKQLCKRVKEKTEEESVRIIRAAIRNLPETHNAREYLMNDWYFLEEAIQRCWRSFIKPDEEELPYMLTTLFIDAPRHQWKTFLADRKKIRLPG